MKKQYEELKSRYNLPNYDDLNKDFEIYSISKEDDIMKELLKKIDGSIDFYISLLEDIIQPDSRFYTLKESNVLDVDLRANVSKIYNKLLFFNRANIELHLDYSDEMAAEFIKKTFDEWQIIKKELLPIIKSLKESWLNNTEIKPDRGYFG